MGKAQTHNDDASFYDMLTSFDQVIQEISMVLRDLISDIMPGVTEVVWLRQKIAGYGVGPKKMSEHFCYIAPQKNYVNLGFY